MTEDDRLFMRELLLRYDRHQDTVIGELRAQRAQSERQFEKTAAWIDDMRAEIRAQTRGLLQVIDRMDRLGGGPATA